MDRTLLLIPAFNAQLTIAKLIPQILLHMENQRFDILVVDDGSEDQTGLTAKKLGANVIRHEKNLGKGAALKSGFKYAINNDYPLIVTLDADLQHDPSSLTHMLAFLNTHAFDIVIGSRMFDRKKMSMSRILSNKITSRLISFRAKQAIPDSQSGYRIIRTSVVQNIVLRTNKFETESEILIKLAGKKARFGFFPVETIYAGEKSNIRHIRDTLRFIKMYIFSFFY